MKNLHLRQRHYHPAIHHHFRAPFAANTVCDILRWMWHYAPEYT